MRSEDVLVQREAATGTIDATVGLSELVGADRLVELHSSLGRLVARTSITDIFQPGEKAYVTLSRERLHLFDAENGERRGHQKEEAVGVGVRRAVQNS